MSQTSEAAANGAPAAGARPVLSAVPFPVMVIDRDDGVAWVNGAAELFFGLGTAQLRGQRLEALLAEDSPLVSLLHQVRASGSSISEHDVTLLAPRGNGGVIRLSVTGAPVAEPDGEVVLTLHPLSIASKIDRQLVHRSAARSASAMSRMLAHEVKNPLSGIRGAAQLLERSVEEADRSLTRLICEEADRICELVDRMDVFSDSPATDRGPINIHEVLERVRMIAQTGFGRDVRFVERYDPSLPPVYGNRDQLIQIFLNLVKNAAEAAPKVGGELVLRTSYQHGIRLALPGGRRRIQLPLVVSVQDNGPGVPLELANDLFDPFVTSKRTGTGLGLALVAKLVGDHGGVIEFESEPGRTVFRVMLPIMAAESAGDAA